MEKWLVASLATLVLWGAWGVVLKRASEGLEWYQVYLYSNMSIIIVITLILLLYHSNLNVGLSKASLAFAAGLMGTTGYILLIIALRSGGNASIVIPLTGLYPAITAILSYALLGESMSPRKAIGVLLALIAIVLMSE